MKITRLIDIAYGSMASMKTRPWFPASDPKEIARINAYLIFAVAELFVIGSLISTVITVFGNKWRFSSLFGIPLAAALVFSNAYYFDKDVTRKAISEFMKYSRGTQILIRISVFAFVTASMAVFLALPVTPGR
jgi:uncharacterized membrane protein